MAAGVSTRLWEIGDIVARAASTGSGQLEMVKFLGGYKDAFGVHWLCMELDDRRIQCGNASGSFLAEDAQALERAGLTPSSLSPRELERAIRLDKIERSTRPSK